MWPRRFLSSLQLALSRPRRTSLTPMSIGSAVRGRSRWLCPKNMQEEDHPQADLCAQPLPQGEKPDSSKIYLLYLLLTGCISPQLISVPWALLAFVNVITCAGWYQEVQQKNELTIVECLLHLGHLQILEVIICNYNLPLQHVFYLAGIMSFIW